jgi:hypothetical protein
MGESQIRDVGSLLAAFFDEEKLRRGGRYAQFFESWKAVVGEHLASHSRVVDLDKGILLVEADHPGWIQLLQLRQTQALNALTKRFPDLPIRGIAFRLSGAEYGLGGKLAGGPAAEAAPDAPAPAEEEDTALQEEANAPSTHEAGTRDPEFTAAFSSLKRAIREGKGK